MFFIDLGTQSHYSVLGISPTATVEEIRTAKDKLVKELRDKQKLAKTEAERKPVDDREKYLNQISDTLIRREKREKYDSENAHLGFLTVQTVTAGIFAEKSDRLHVLHRILREFFSVKGVELQPLSDVDREDFLSDETPVALLENILKQI